MRVQNVVTVLAIAAITASFALVAFGPQGVGARDDAKIKALLAQPEFSSQGCKFTVKADKEAYDVGQSPTLAFTASNPGDKPADATVWILVSASAPTSPFARMLPIPESVWSHKLTVNLKPGETKTETIETKLTLPTGKEITITLSDKNQVIVAGDLRGRAATVPVQTLPTVKQNAEAKP